MTKEKLKRFILLVALVIGVVAVPTAPVGAVNAFKNNDTVDAVCKDNATKDSAVCASKGDDVNKFAANIVSILLFAIGIVSVIMIIVGGLRYTTSNGDSARITAAKNTILYAVIGLVVALLAFGIVNFVVAQFK
jgi:hypothetical protein